MSKPYHLAVIAEASCIGCTKCIAVCPFDAIIGATGHMHTVLNDLCVGCDLCIPACPVQCIRLEPTQMSQEQRKRQAQLAKSQFQAREHRLMHQAEQKRQADLQASENAAAILEAALARAKQKKQEVTWTHE